MHCFCRVTSDWSVKRYTLVLVVTSVVRSTCRSRQAVLFVLVVTSAIRSTGRPREAVLFYRSVRCSSDRSIHGLFIHPPIGAAR